jgi:glycolate oxidase
MDKVAADLTRILGPERLLWEREHLATYGFDGTAALYAEAGCVALAKTTAEVTQIVRYAAQNKIPVVTRGSGTGSFARNLEITEKRPRFFSRC